jgi:hypothetical protein
MVQRPGSLCPRDELHLTHDYSFTYAPRTSDDIMFASAMKRIIQTLFEECYFIVSANENLWVHPGASGKWIDKHPSIPQFLE